MKTHKVYRTVAFHLTVISAAALSAICLLTNPANARWGGGYGGRGGFHYGGDGFGGGDPTSSSRSSEYQSRYGSSYHPSGSSAESYHSTNQSARYNEANSMN